MKNNNSCFLNFSRCFVYCFNFVSVSSGYIDRLTYKVNIKTETPVTSDSYKSWENCLEQLNIKADVVFIGDSLTANGNFQKAFPNTSVCNLGCYGDRIVNVRSRISTVSSLHPS